MTEGTGNDVPACASENLQSSKTGGALHLATRMGLSPIVVGLAVAASGTSAPELTVSIGPRLSGPGNAALFGIGLSMPPAVRPG